MSYESSDIKVLQEIEHIRLNPGMYIGDTSNPVHLIEEALDNSLDECLGGYGNIVAVIIDTKKSEFSVLDDGRGIPYKDDKPIVISTKLFSGAKFHTKKTAYEICAGLHGVGLVAVNALSDYYKLEIYRNNHHAIFDFEKAKLKNKKIESFNEKPPFSTKITFKPSEKIFETLEPNIDRIRRRLLTASVELPDSTFVLYVNGKKEIIKKDVEKYFEEVCLSKSDTDLSKTFIAESKDGVENFEVRFVYSYTGSNAPKVAASINLLPVNDGGSHINGFYEILREIFSNQAKKLNVKIQPNDCLCGLRAYLKLSLKNPKFGGQTKEKLLNKKVDLEKLVRRLKTSVVDTLFSDKEELENILSHFEQYRRKLNSKSIKTFDGRKRLSTKFTKLKDCTGKNGEIFIVEGDSAAGSFVSCRDPRKHAIFPLKGKIPNVVNAKDILKNKEISELIQSLGCGVKDIDFDITKLKYDKIIISTDADADGGHIASLTALCLAILTPDVVKEGHVYIVRTPLYAINEGKIFIPIWTDEELKKAKENKRKISRFKGLGELNPNQLKVTAIDEKTRKLIPVTYTKNINKIKKLFSDAEEKRKLLRGEK